MITPALIVFREIFEIAIIISVISAATKSLPQRTICIVTGILLGTLAVGVVALFGNAILNVASQLGQHVFHAIVLFTAALLIAVSVIWMQQHGRQMTREIKQLSELVLSGQKPLYMLGLVVALAVLREGSEIVLFLYGIYHTGDATVIEIISGSILGLLTGIATGFVMYYGLAKIPVKQLFAYSGGLLTLLAAGMVAKGVSHLVKAQMLPAIINPLWDTSTIVSQHSLLGRFLSILIGYQDQPTAIAVIFYLSTLAIVTLVLRLVSYRSQFLHS